MFANRYKLYFFMREFQKGRRVEFFTLAGSKSDAVENANDFMRINDVNCFFEITDIRKVIDHISPGDVFCADTLGQLEFYNKNIVGE